MSFFPIPTSPLHKSPSRCQSLKGQYNKDMNVAEEKKKMILTKIYKTQKFRDKYVNESIPVPVKVTSRFRPVNLITIKE